MTKTTFKEKSMKKQSLVAKEASNRQHQTPGRPNHTYNPPNNLWYASIPLSLGAKLVVAQVKCRFPSAISKMSSVIFPTIVCNIGLWIYIDI